MFLFDTITVLLPNRHHLHHCPFGRSTVCLFVSGAGTWKYKPFGTLTWTTKGWFSLWGKPERPSTIAFGQPGELVPFCLNYPYFVWINCFGVFLQIAEDYSWAVQKRNQLERSEKGLQKATSGEVKMVPKFYKYFISGDGSLCLVLLFSPLLHCMC